MVKKKQSWESRGICGGSDVNFFSEADLPENATQAETDFSTLETMRAQSICANCPVRRECLESAIANKDRFGVWGGADQTTIRKALSIDESGNPVQRARDMVCPYCNSRNIAIKVRRRTQTQIACPECSMTWWAAKPIRQEDVEKFGNNVE